MILEAIRASNSLTTKTKSLQTYDEDEGFDPVEASVGVSDAMPKLVKKHRRMTTHTRKGVMYWNNLDFLNYFKSLIKDHGLTVDTSPRVSLNYVAQLYDLLADNIQNGMDNYTMRDYLEWWVVNNGPYQPHRVHLGKLLDDRYIEKFLIKYREMMGTEAKSVAVDVDTDPEKILKAGGLQLLLITKGLFIACDILSRTGEREPETQIELAAQKLSSQMSKHCLDATIRNAPYPKESPIDLFALADPIIRRHNLDDYANKSWSAYFA